MYEIKINGQIVVEKDITPRSFEKPHEFALRIAKFFGATCETRQIGFTEQIETIREDFIDCDFGMFTKAGGKRIRKSFFKLLDDVKSATLDKGVMKSFENYFKRYAKIKKMKTHTESGDTAVRESVWCAALEVAKTTGTDAYDLDVLWNKIF